MYWILATVFLLIALAVPKLRPIGIGGCVILGLMLIWGMVQRLGTETPDPANTRGSPTAPTTALRVFPLDLLETSNLHIAGNGAPFEVRGHAVNKATDMRLKSFTVNIARRDCYEGALDPSGCELLWQSTQWIELPLATGEARDFASSFWTRGEVARARGKTQDSIEVISADGEAAPAVEAP